MLAVKQTIIIMWGLVLTAFSPAANHTKVQIESDRDHPFWANHGFCLVLTRVWIVFTPFQTNQTKGINSLEFGQKRTKQIWCESPHNVVKSTQSQSTPVIDTKSRDHINLLRVKIVIFKTLLDWLCIQICVTCDHKEHNQDKFSYLHEQYDPGGENLSPYFHLPYFRSLSAKKPMIDWALKRIIIGWKGEELLWVACCTHGSRMAGCELAHQKAVFLSQIALWRVPRLCLPVHSLFLIL